MNSNKTIILITTFLLLFDLLTAQNDYTKFKSDSFETQKKIKVSETGYGGPALKISKFNNQIAFMSGGRGSCIINEKFTIGGGGYGIANKIRIKDEQTGKEKLYKMGYGGLELGYIFKKTDKYKFGSSVLFASGASFWLSEPKNKSESIFKNDFEFLYVIEPSLYTEIKLKKFLVFHTGISYRYIGNDKSSYLLASQKRGFSIYFGFLLGE